MTDSNLVDALVFAALVLLLVGWWLAAYFLALLCLMPLMWMLTAAALVIALLAWALRVCLSLLRSRWAKSQTTRPPRGRQPPPDGR